MAKTDPTQANREALSKAFRSALPKNSPLNKSLEDEDEKLRKLRELNKPKIEGLIPFKEGMAASSEEAIQNKQTNEMIKSMAGLPSEASASAEQVKPLVTEESQEQRKMPALVQKAMKKDAVKTSKALDNLQEGVTGEKVNESNKMSDEMKTALLAGLPILLGGLLGGEEGLGVGAQAGLKGLEAKQKAEAAKAKGALERDKLDAQKQQAQSLIDVQREAIASKERIAGINRATTLMGLKQQSDKEIMQNTVPDVGVALNSDDAKLLKEKKITLDNVTQGIDRINEISSRSLASLSPEQRVAAQTEVQALIGQLRIPLTGPGPMTDTEREFMADIIGNPTKILSLSSNERVKLNTIKNKFTSDFENEREARTVEGLQRAEIRKELKRRGL